MKLWFPLFFVIYELCGYLSNDMYLPAMLSMAGDFSTSISLVQLSIGAWMMGNGLAQIILGPLSDRFGRKPVLLGGGALYICTLILCGLCSTIMPFLLLRFLQGMGVASIMIAGYATIHEYFDDKQATRILALTGSVSILAPMLGPLFGALILESSSWRMIFFVLLIPTLLALLALGIVMPAKHRAASHRTFWQLCARYKEIFANKIFIYKSLAYGFYYSCIMLWITSSPYLMMGLGGMSERSYSLWQIPVFLALIAGANTIRLLEQKLGFTQIIHVGQSVCLMGAVLLSSVALFFQDPRILVLAYLPVTFGVGMLSAPLARKAMTTPKLEQGVITGAFFLLMGVVGGVITMVVSMVAKEAISFGLCLSALSVIGYLFFRWSQQLKNR